MPIIRIEMFDGRPEKMKRELIRRVSETCAEVLDLPLEHIQLILTEVPKKHWARGGVPYSQKKLEGKGYRHTR